MNRKMTLTGASAKAEGQGKVQVKISLEVETSADMARDIILEAGEILDQEVDCKIEAIQAKMNLKK